MKIIVNCSSEDTTVQLQQPTLGCCSETGQKRVVNGSYYLCFNYMSSVCPGPVRLLLGLQHHRRSGGAAVQENGQTGVAERAEPGRLFWTRGQRGLQRRPDGPGLPVRQGQPGPGLRGLLPLHGNCTYLIFSRPKVLKHLVLKHGFASPFIN